LHFTNDFKDPMQGLDRNLIVDWIALQGPIGVARPASPGADLVLLCSPDPELGEQGEATCAEDILWTFGMRAWRRPMTDDEFASKMAIYGQNRNAGGDWEEAVGNMIKAVLLAPHFVYRVELDPKPESKTAHLVAPYELASRLSYFLWSTMPDEQLFALARTGELQNPLVLEGEVRRMLADPKAWALVDNLGGQWLYVRGVDEAYPDIDSFPDWDEGLRASMKEEMRLLVGDVLLTDRSMFDLMLTKDTFVDARLAEHYGLPAPSVDGFERTSLDGTQRRGLLTTAGLLTALSYPTRNSPVKRGKWVLDNILCDEPPDPPPGVEGLPDDPTTEALTLREQMEQHQADPLCATCHSVLDPIGFSMEHYNGIGQRREVDEQGFQINSSGQLPDSDQFDGIAELVDILVLDERMPACMAEKTFTYAIGRGPSFEDVLDLEKIEAQFTASDHRFEALAVAIVLSEAFRYRHGGAE
jgi:hypothetical protein